MRKNNPLAYNNYRARRYNTDRYARVRRRRGAARSSCVVGGGKEDRKNRCGRQLRGAASNHHHTAAAPSHPYNTPSTLLQSVTRSNARGRRSREAPPARPFVTETSRGGHLLMRSRRYRLLSSLSSCVVLSRVVRRARAHTNIALFVIVTHVDNAEYEYYNLIGYTSFSLTPMVFSYPTMTIYLYCARPIFGIVLK